MPGVGAQGFHGRQHWQRPFRERDSRVLGVHACQIVACLGVCHHSLQALAYPRLRIAAETEAGLPIHVLASVRLAAASPPCPSKNLPSVL